MVTIMRKKLVFIVVIALAFMLADVQACKDRKPCAEGERRIAWLTQLGEDIEQRLGPPSRDLGVNLAVEELYLKHSPICKADKKMLAGTLRKMLILDGIDQKRRSSWGEVPFSVVDGSSEEGSEELLRDLDRNPEVLAILHEDRERARRLLAGLPEELRSTVALFYFHEISVTDIARIRRVSRRTVYNHLRRAEEMILRKQLEERSNFRKLLELGRTTSPFAALKWEIEHILSADLPPEVRLEAVKALLGRGSPRYDKTMLKNVLARSGSPILGLKPVSLLPKQEVARVQAARGGLFRLP